MRNYRLKLLWEPSDSVKLVSTTSYTENFAGEDILDPSNGVRGAILDASEVIRDVAYDTPGEEGTETFIQSLNLTWAINDAWELQSITTYQGTDYVRVEDFDVTPAPIAALDREGADEAFSQELRIKYEGERLRGALGFYYLDTDDGFNDSFAVPAALIDPRVPPSVLVGRDSSTSRNVENKALFFDGEYALNDNLDLLFGARYDDEEQVRTQISSTRILTPIPPGFEQLQALARDTTEETNADFDAFLPKLGVRWKPTDDATFAFVVQRAYRAGCSEISFITGEVEEFDPEYLWNYELSARTHFLDGRLKWNTNIFYADWEDQQIEEALPAPFNRFSRTVNGGESRLYGLETDVSFELNDEIEVYGGFGYTDTEFTNFPNSDFDPSEPVSEANPENFNGNRFAYSPEFSFNIGVDFKQDNGWFGGVDVNYQDESFSSTFNREVNSDTARTLVNARIGYQFNDNLTITAYARNLFDEDYYEQLNREDEGGFTARLGDQRTAAVRVDWSF